MAPEHGAQVAKAVVPLTDPLVLWLSTLHLSHLEEGSDSDWREPRWEALGCAAGSARLEAPIPALVALSRVGQGSTWPGTSRTHASVVRRPDFGLFIAENRDTAALH